jgi:putative ABC transport system permease protein
VVVAAMVVAVMLTTGRTVGAQQQVLRSIDVAGTRAIVVRAETGAGLTTEVLDRLAPVQGIEWAGAFSSAVDARNALLPGATNVPARYAYGADLSRLGITTAAGDDDQLAYASPLALADLGLPDVAGGITLQDGTTRTVAAQVTTPDYLSALEPLVLIPRQSTHGAAPINVLVVVAATPALITPLAQTVTSLLAPDDPTKVSVQTSEDLARLRALVDDQLGLAGRGLVLALLVLTAGLVAVLTYALATMRRRDYGRRRALGATRSLIVTLLLTQTALLAGVGAVLGVAVATAVVVVGGDPHPGAAFTIALVILAVATAELAAVLPAVSASRREPIKELRVP